MSTAPTKPIKAEPASLILNTNPGLIVIKPSISIREFTGQKKFFMARCCMIETPIILAKIIKNSDPQNRLHDPAPTTARFNPNDRTIQPQRLHTSVKTVRRLFPLPFIFFCRKRKKASGFFKNVSGFKRKHFGEWDKTFRRFQTAGKRLSLATATDSLQTAGKFQFPGSCRLLSEKGKRAELPFCTSTRHFFSHNPLIIWHLGRH